jgi:hypothetical protein
MGGEREREERGNEREKRQGETEQSLRDSPVK